MSKRGDGVVAPVPGVPVYRRDQSERCEDLVVAVHGMGDQVRNDFAQQIAELFAKHAIMEKGAPHHQATRLALGTWDAGKARSTEDDALGFVPAVDRSAAGQGTPWLNPFAFAEVHWATLPRVLETEGHRLEESTHWAGSVVGRVSQRHGLPDKFGTTGPQVAAEAIEGIGETLHIISRLLVLGSKVGLGKVDLAGILEKYLADVQQLAEYRGSREKCVREFIDRMAVLDALTEREDGSRADIHIVAHSEGTVLSFLALLTALHIPQEQGEGAERLGWIERVRSFTTIGSPIDKHLILWPEMWFKFCFGKRDPVTGDEPEVSSKDWRKLPQPIRWRNYYDLADPVGFDLDTARAQLASWECDACFDFEDHHDHGFRRYPISGKAHVDYFGDTKLFGYIIRDAIDDEPPATDGAHDPPDTFVGKLSPWIPYIVAILIHLVAVFVVYKAVGTEVADTAASVEKNSVQEAERFDADEKISLLGILGCGALLFGTTACTRLLRLARGWEGWALGIGTWIVCAAIFHIFAGLYTIEVVGWIGITGHGGSVGLFLGLSIFLVTLPLVLDRHALKDQKRPVVGLRWLVRIGGGAVVVFLILPKLISGDGSALVVFGSGAAFVYLWWLGIRLFDLAYIWGRYVNRRNNDIVERVRQTLVEEPVSRELCYESREQERRSSAE